MARRDRGSAAKPAARVDRGTATPGATGSCAALEAEADLHCRAADAARLELLGLGERLALARAEQAERRQAALEAEAAAGPDRYQTARTRARDVFEAARAAAGSAEDIAAAAGEWLAEIDRINAAAADAEGRLERERAAAQIATAMAEHLAAEAESARLAAEAADAACRAAREAAAACAEALQRAAAERAAAERQAAESAAAAQARAAGAGSGPMAAPGETGTPEARQGAAERALGLGPAPATGDPGTAPAGAGAPVTAEEPGGGGEPEAGGGASQAVAPGTEIHRILSGDLTRLTTVAARLGGDAQASARWEGRLTDLLEAILLRAVDAGAIALPINHAFWGAFTPEQSRDIMSALAVLGCRFDGLGGWLDDRLPTQRDLSLAVAHAGLDPMRVRHWPTLAEAEELVRDAEVLGVDYLQAAAPGLTLAQMTTLLGQDALALADVWLEWERIREVLLAGEPMAGDALPT